MKRLLVLLFALSLSLNFLPTQAAAQVGDLEKVWVQDDPAVRTLGAEVSPRPATLDLNGIDAFIEAVMEEFKIPGLAVAAIQDGEVVLSKGYGLRNVDENLPVTDRTLFAIGSNSKSFTANILGQLVDEGKLDWDKPLKTYLPDFQLYDPVATMEFTPRDLVTHRSGLPRHDGLWYGRSFSREELYQRLKYIQPTASLRTRYQYQNLMFMTAGVLAERITGKSWEQLLEERIFQPLGMTRSNPSTNDMPRDPDASLPYMEIEDEVQAVPYRNIDAVGPAGSINSSVEEMLHYIQMNIDQGTYQGRQILSERMAGEMQRPQFVTSSSDPEFPELGYGSYGHGVAVSTYRGYKLVAHGGGIDGFISSMSWMPHEKIGIMVLTNFSGINPVPTLVRNRIYDELLGLEPVDWLGRTREDLAEARDRREQREKEKEESRATGTSPSHPLGDYAGIYEHPGYGTMEIRVGEQGLEVTYDQFEFSLNHWHYDVFEAEGEPGGPDEMMVMFLYDKEGVVDRLLAPLEPNVDDIVFKKRVEEEGGM